MGQMWLEKKFISIKDAQNLLDKKNVKELNVKKLVVYSISKDWRSKSGQSKKMKRITKPNILYAMKT
jgi:hypothetical protein